MKKLNLFTLAFGAALTLSSTAQAHARPLACEAQAAKAISGLAAADKSIPTRLILKRAKLTYIAMTNERVSEESFTYGVDLKHVTVTMIREWNCAIQSVTVEQFD